jgi:hypothetical protein
MWGGRAFMRREIAGMTGAEKGAFPVCATPGLDASTGKNAPGRQRKASDDISEQSIVLFQITEILLHILFS